MQAENLDQDRFIQAAFEGDVATVRAYVEAGVDINLAPKWWNALHHAVENMQVEVVRYLLEAGADPNMPCGGCRPLHHSIDIEADSSAQTGEPLQCVITPMLVEAGADVNGLDQDGRTPLDWALDHRHEPAIELLRSRGARLNKPAIDTL